VSRRARAIAFACAALACAALAAGLAGGYRGEVESQLGELRSVVVARTELAAGRPLRPSAVRRGLELRRVPDRFAPVDALGSIEDAIGLVPRSPVPPGGYLLSSQLRAPGSGGGQQRIRLPPGREPVDIAVTAAESLAAGGDPGGMPVDVIVTTEPGPGGGKGRTYVAAGPVRLLELRPEGVPPPEPDTMPAIETSAWIATMALTREQALRLIQAESFARQVRLIRH
jgi:Flp pilus assembly protein CpaB